jgi:hypothetical protein
MSFRSSMPPRSEEPGDDQARGHRGGCSHGEPDKGQQGVGAQAAGPAGQPHHLHGCAEWDRQPGQQTVHSGALDASAYSADPKTGLASHRTRISYQ